MASGGKPKAYFFLTEFMPFKSEYNSNFDTIFVKNIYLSFSANLTTLPISHILQKILLCVQQNKDINTCLKLLEYE